MSQQLLVVRVSSEVTCKVDGKSTGQKQTEQEQNRSPGQGTVAPVIAAAEPQIVPPSTIAPCEIIITAAFMRPRAQLGTARCAATQSSEADNVHPTPASAATMKSASVRRTSAINT